MKSNEYRLIPFEERPKREQQAIKKFQKWEKNWLKKNGHIEIKFQHKGYRYAR